MPRASFFLIESQAIAANVYDYARERGGRK